MSARIQNFPDALQPIIQQGFLDREFQAAITSRPGFRLIATRVFVKSTLEEQDVDGVTVKLSHYAATTDLNMVTSRVGIASQFLLNTAINGEQAGRACDELARNALSKAVEVSKHTAPLNMEMLLNAVGRLRFLNVREVDGAYNCYLDPISARQLFSDNDFRHLFAGATSATQIFRRGMVNDFLGLRFIPVNDTFYENTRRVWIAGEGAVTEYVPDDVLAMGIGPDDAVESVVENAVMVTREPIDRLQQIIAQSWYYVGEFHPVAGRALALDISEVTA